jgi:hypothetical protein
MAPPHRASAERRSNENAGAVAIPTGCSRAALMAISYAVDLKVITLASMAGKAAPKADSYIANDFFGERFRSVSIRKTHEVGFLEHINEDPDHRVAGMVT